MSHREGPDSPLSSYPSHKGPLPSPTHSSGLQRHPRSSEGLRAGSAKPQSSPAGHQTVTQCGSGSSRHKRQGDGPEASTFYTAVPSSTTRALLQQTYSKPRSHVGCSSRVHEPREAGPAGSSFYTHLLHHPFPFPPVSLLRGRAGTAGRRPGVGGKQHTVGLRSSSSRFCPPALQPPLSSHCSQLFT